MGRAAHSVSFALSSLQFTVVYRALQCVARGLPPGPSYKRLKQGHAVTTQDGHVIEPHEVVSAPKRGRKIVVMGDTWHSASSPMARAAQDADVSLYCLQ